MALPAALQDSLRLPVVAAPMFLGSGPDMVCACCEAGIVGTFPALNQRSTAGFDQWLTDIETRLHGFGQRTGRTPAPYGINLIVHKSNPRLQADLEVCLRHRVPLVITSLGAASALVEQVHAAGGLVFHDVTTARFARKAADAGVDGLIAVAAGAGGHAGNWSPFALVAEIRRFFDKTLLLAGCISTGRDVAAAETMGADLAYMGTRFLATRESMATAGYKQMLRDSSAADIVYTPAISGIPANFLRASLQAAGLDPDNLRTSRNASLATELAEIAQPESGASAWRDIWSAGQGVAAIDDIPSVSELVERLKAEYCATLTARQEQRTRYCS